MNALEIILKSQKLAKEGAVIEAEKGYLEAIELLKNTVSVNPSTRAKAELWSTEAEYLVFKANFIKKGETISDARNRLVSAIRLLFRTSALTPEYAEYYAPKLNKLVSQAILVFGCILPDDERKVYIECPIRLKNMSAGNWGFSIGLFSKKAECSICERDILNDSLCKHVVGQSYGGKVCKIKYNGVKLDHISLTDRPLDPDAGITMLTIPKGEFYERANFKPEEIKLKEKTNLPIICSFCKEQGIDPHEISPKIYFKMQHIENELDV